MANISSTTIKSFTRPSLAALQTLEDIQAIQPVWLRVPGASRVSALSRQQIFEGIATGKILSKHLKRPGAQKGVRLINYASLMSYVDSLES
jgi:hypothetical protein